MTPQQFIKKWKASTLKERSAAQEHFIDLCQLIGEQTPAEADPNGSWYCFERGAKKTGGGEGWADVWRRGYFAWEYKGKHKDLTAAFAQLQRYAIALENPPCLVVSDMDTILIHTNFTNTVQEIHAIPLAELDGPGNVQKLKWLFTDPERFRPGRTTAAITEEAASKFAALAEVLRRRGSDPQRVAHFLNKLLFCLFAEDAGLLPPRLVVRLLEAGLKHPGQANAMLRSLFGAMTKGGLFGADLIDWFNGGLFDSDDAIPLEVDDVKEILSVARLDWSSIEPSVFGTLFERGLDPSKRAQLGAHYTDPQSIMRIVQPVVIDPLAAEWQAAKIGIERALAMDKKGVPVTTKKKKLTSTPAKKGPRQEAEALYNGFLHRLAQFRVLDPACGSGNFLYLALQALKDLEHRVMLEAEQIGLHAGFVGMNVGVQCVRGIELNTYAAELARVTVWIGEIQWMLRHGVPPSKNPILKPLETIECRDAVMNDDGTETTWPTADAIVGNPPFLGDKRMNSDLGDDYVRKLRRLYGGRVPGAADLVCYWFEKARAAVAEGRANRVGLVATNSIRQSTNRQVLERIRDTGRIFNAWSDEPWINEGAAVRVSIVSFAKEHDGDARLDGKKVEEILSDLTAGSAATPDHDFTKARRLPENQGRSFFGLCLAGPFAIDGEKARTWLVDVGNPNRRSNADVLRPILNGIDLTRRPQDRWVIDFGTSMTEEEAAAYEAPFEYVVREVKPGRLKNNRKGRALRWWLHGETRPGMRRAIAGLTRFIATPERAKHRYFVWVNSRIAPEHRLVVIPRDDDTAFGILHSKVHVLWALRMGSTLEDRPGYNTKVCFETFPFPQGLTLDTPAENYGQDLRAVRIAKAARDLNQARDNWLNPAALVRAVNEAVRGYPERFEPVDAAAAKELKRRTLTTLYNANPSWLVQAHRKLDEAVLDAYGWPLDLPQEEILDRLLHLNQSRAASVSVLPLATQSIV